MTYPSAATRSVSEEMRAVWGGLCSQTEGLAGSMESPTILQSGMRGLVAESQGAQPN
jgi:hypothetical protein